MLGVLDTVFLLLGNFVTDHYLAFFNEENLGDLLVFIVEDGAPLLRAWLEHPQQLHHEVTIGGIEPVVENTLISAFWQLKECLKVLAELAEQEVLEKCILHLVGQLAVDTEVFFAFEGAYFVCSPSVFKVLEYAFGEIGVEVLIVIETL